MQGGAMAQPSRIEQARRRLRIARYAIAALGVGTFAGVAAVAQAMHPGRAANRGRAGQASLPSEPVLFSNAAAQAGAQASVPISPAPTDQQAVVQSSGS